MPSLQKHVLNMWLKHVNLDYTDKAIGWCNYYGASPDFQTLFRNTFILQSLCRSSALN